MNKRRPSLPTTTTFLVIAGTVAIVTRDELNQVRAITLVHSFAEAKRVLDDIVSTEAREQDDFLSVFEHLELALGDDGDFPETDPRPSISVPSSILAWFDGALLKGLETLMENRGQLLDDLFNRLTQNRDLAVCQIADEPMSGNSCLLLLYALRGKPPAATLITSAEALRALLDETRGTNREEFYKSLEPMFPRLARARGSSIPLHLSDPVTKILIIGAQQQSSPHTAPAPRSRISHLTN